MVAEILNVFKTRLSSPVLMSIFVSFVLLNWQAFYYVIFSGAPPIFSAENWWQTSKFDYWEEYMVWWRYLIPIPIGLSYALFSPKIALWAAKFTSSDINAKRMLEKEEASKLLELEAELQAARNLAAKAVIDKAELDERASNIKDPSIRGELEQNIKSIDRLSEEIVLPVPEIFESVEIKDASQNPQIVSDSEANISNIKEIDNEDHENFDENARKLEIYLRYKALKDEAQFPSKSKFEVFASVKKLREVEGPQYDPYKINLEIDELMSTANAILERLKELDYEKDLILYEQMSGEFHKIVDSILTIYGSLKFEDDIPF